MSTLRKTVIALACALAATPALAQADLLTEKKTFEMPSYTTVGGGTIKNVKIGWESYGTLNADRSNAILVTHFFSGTSHAAGKYKADEKVPGYWDPIIGPGKALDTNKYFVLSSDTLVNLNANLPGVVTTGPASIDPDTGKPYGMPQNRSGYLVKTSGPGTMPWIVSAPSISAITAFGGRPRLRSGMKQVCAAALLAASGPATPSGAPLPKRVGSRAIFFSRT